MINLLVQNGNKPFLCENKEIFFIFFPPNRPSSTQLVAVITQLLHRCLGHFLPPPPTGVHGAPAIWGYHTLLV